MNVVAAPVWEESEEKQTIYFSNTKNESDVYAYVWVIENEVKHELKDWDHKEMATYVELNEYGQKVWKYTFSVSYENIIFVFGDAQTVDIVIADMDDDTDGVYPTDKDGDNYAVDYYKFSHYVAKTLDHITVEYTGGDIYVDGEIDMDDVEVTAYYTDDSDEVVTEDIDLDYDASEAADNVTVTVTYGGKTATFKVNVVAAPEPQNITIYFTNNKGWENVYAYVFTGETPKAEWPGEKMTFAGQNDQNPKQDVYSYTFLDSFECIIFTNGEDGNANQTVNIALSGLTDDNNAYYLDAQVAEEGGDKGKWTVGQWECDPAELTQPKTLSYIVAEYTGSDVVAGGSVAKSDITVTAYYSDDSHETVEDFEIGEYDNVEGKDDITITYQGKTDTITVTFVAAVAPQNITIYFTNNKGWENVYAYVFTGETPKAEWPGEKMTFAGQNDQNPKQDVYSYTFLDSFECIIFTNGEDGNANQTVNIALSGLTDDNNAYYLDAQVAEEGGDKGKWTVGQWECDPAELTQPKTLSYIVAEYTGSDVVAGGSVAKSDITVTAYYSDDSHETVEDFEIGEYDNVEGKDDITITYQGKTDTITVTFVAAVAWNGVVTFNVSGVTDEGGNKWFENDDCVAYIYVWYTDDTNNGWPTTENAETHKATRTTDYIYTFQTDTSKTIAGLIVVRGKADGSAMYNKSGDLTDTESHVITVSSMLAY